MDSLLERNRGYILIILIALVIGGGSLLASRRQEPKPLSIQVPTVASNPTPSPLIKVHIGGAVVSPGVYTFKAGDRVEDAVTAAGGFTAEANRDSLNLAARLLDGQQIIISKLGEPTPTPSASGRGTPTPSKININTASLPELESLTGIGPVTAQKIVDYRLQNGPFKRLEDLLDLKLVPASTFDKIKEMITY
jgi:competence protein ComEA